MTPFREGVTTTVSASWAGLVEDLAAEGVLPEQWRTAFLTVPREVFIPEVIWCDDGDDLVPLRRAEDPDEWRRRVYGPGYVVTQVDDGIPAGPGGRGQVATSSASRPDIVALMLEAGRVEPGMRVLEIGTGTGYTAALLAHRLGARNVTSIEVDHDLAARARAALATAGYGEVTVITGDGARGHSAGAPFDRVLSTVGGDGTATGGLVNTTISFMLLREQRIHRPAVAEIIRDTDTPDVSDTDLHASHLCHDDAPFAIAAQVPRCHWEYVPATGDDGCWCV